VVVNCWGWIQSFGVFQSYFTRAFNEPPSRISWIGSLQVFLLFGIGIFSGRALDAGYFKQTLSVGLAFQMVGMFTLSASKTYWQALLSGGVTQGIGAGLVFCPTVALISTYFAKKRAVAIALGASGSGVGGIIYPLIVRNLLPKIGFGWTVRVCGFVMGTLGVISVLVLHTRVAPRKSGPLIELAAFKELPFTLFCIGTLLFFCGIFFPFYYVSSFGRDIIGFSYESSALVLIVINTVGVFARLGPNFLADRYTGPAKLMVFMLFCTSIVVYGWSGVSSKGGLWGWSISFAITGSSVQSLFPAALSTLTADPRKQGTRMGIGFAFASVGGLIGSPLGGALISAKHGDYLYAQMFAASAIFAGFVVIFASVWTRGNLVSPVKQGWRAIILK
jgi:MFS family permease